MDRENALEVLGLNADADPTEISQAYASRKADIEAKKAQAPTEALQAKYSEALGKLDMARQVLLPRRNPLSETKLADLPSASASATRMGNEAASTGVDIKAGTVLADRYEIRERIGVGGMGAVFRAFDRNRNEDIAIKVLVPSLTSNERARERFLDEARLSSKLSHPGIVNVYDVQNDGPLYFITMELLEGQDLRQVMEARKLARQAFAPIEVKEILTEMGRALAYAHQHTVHRDIKPENIWVTETGTYKLMDFGIARLLTNSQHTQTSAVMGTAYYMAPEQLKASKSIDGRADQYALAVLGYELLTGDIPAGVIESLEKARRDTPRGMARALMRALSPKPESRFPDISEFTDALSGKGSGMALGGLFADPRLKVAGVVVFSGVLLAAALSQGWLNDAWNTLRPTGAEEKRAQQADAVRLQGQVSSLERQLENARSNLAAELKDAERRGAPEVPALQRWYESTERYLFSGSLMSELEGEKALADLLLRDREYGPAAQAWERVKTGYQGAIHAFQAGESLWQAERSAEEARAARDKIERDNGVKPPQDILEIARSFEMEARRSEEEGELVAAAKAWTNAGEKWREAVSQMVELQHRAAYAALDKSLTALNEEFEWSSNLRVLQYKYDIRRDGNFLIVNAEHIATDIVDSIASGGRISPDSSRPFRVRAVETYTGSIDISRIYSVSAIRKADPLQQSYQMVNFDRVRETDPPGRWTTQLQWDRHGARENAIRVEKKTRQLATSSPQGWPPGEFRGHRESFVHKIELIASESVLRDFVAALQTLRKRLE